MSHLGSSLTSACRNPSSVTTSSSARPIEVEEDEALASSSAKLCIELHDNLLTMEEACPEAEQSTEARVGVMI